MKMVNGNSKSFFFFFFVCERERKSLKTLNQIKQIVVLKH